MPDIVAEDLGRGHDFKTSLMAGFESGLSKVKKRLTISALCVSSAGHPDGC